jgi:hypothetical protein
MYGVQNIDYHVLINKHEHYYRDIYFIAIFYDAKAQANHILMNYDIYGDLTIEFNENATEAAVNGITRAVSCQGATKTVDLSVTNNMDLKSVKTLTINIPDKR